jgi:hypothetical protein
MNKYLLVLWIVAMTGCPSTVGNAATVDMYYVPIGVETVVAMTEENIERHCQLCEKREISASGIQRINNIIRDAPSGNFNASRVRLKLRYADGTELMIDNDGGVQSSASDVQKKIAPKELDVIRRMIEKH